MTHMKASDILLLLEGKRLEVWKFGTKDGGIGVSYEHCDVKDGFFLIGEYGTGFTFDEACEDYLNKIRGKTLVFNACTDSRHEVKILG